MLETLLLRLSWPFNLDSPPKSVAIDTAVNHRYVLRANFQVRYTKNPTSPAQYNICEVRTVFRESHIFRKIDSALALDYVLNSLWCFCVKHMMSALVTRIL